MRAYGSNLESDQVPTPDPQLALKLLGIECRALTCHPQLLKSCVSLEQCCSGVKTTGTCGFDPTEEGSEWFGEDTVPFSYFLMIF